MLHGLPSCKWVSYSPMSTKEHSRYLQSSYMPIKHNIISLIFTIYSIITSITSPPTWHQQYMLGAATFGDQQMNKSGSSNIIVVKIEVEENKLRWRQWRKVYIDFLYTISIYKMDIYTIRVCNRNPYNYANYNK